MIATQNISLSYSGKPLFKNVNIKFTAGNCYGIIGANGAGKSTFLKVLSGELEPTTGEVVITPGERMAVLQARTTLSTTSYDSAATRSSWATSASMRL